MASRRCRPWSGRCLADLPDAAIQAEVDAANLTLPDYARVHALGAGACDRSVPTAGMATPNGRPQREAILALHAQVLGLSSQDAATA